MERQEFKQMLLDADWSEEDAEKEAASIYDDPKPGDKQDCDGDMYG